MSTSVIRRAGPRRVTELIRARVLSPRAAASFCGAPRGSHPRLPGAAQVDYNRDLACYNMRADQTQWGPPRSRPAADPAPPPPAATRTRALPQLPLLAGAAHHGRAQPAPLPRRRRRHRPGVGGRPASPARLVVVGRGRGECRLRNRGDALHLVPTVVGLLAPDKHDAVRAHAVQRAAWVDAQPQGRVCQGGRWAAGGGGGVGCGALGRVWCPSARPPGHAMRRCTRSRVPWELPAGRPCTALPPPPASCWGPTAHRPLWGAAGSAHRCPRRR